jgi:hypothetical protein
MEIALPRGMKDTEERKNPEKRYRGGCRGASTDITSVSKTGIDLNTGENSLSGTAGLGYEQKCRHRSCGRIVA